MILDSVTSLSIVRDGSEYANFAIWESYHIIDVVPGCFPNLTYISLMCLNDGVAFSHEREVGSFVHSWSYWDPGRLVKHLIERLAETSPTGSSRHLPQLQLIDIVDMHLTPSLVSLLLRCLRNRAQPDGSTSNVNGVNGCAISVRRSVFVFPPAGAPHLPLNLRNLSLTEFQELVDVELGPIC